MKMPNPSKTQLLLIRELQSKPGASFLFQKEWELMLSNALFSQFTSKPRFSSFRALERMGLVEYKLIISGDKTVAKYYLTEKGINY